MKLTLILILSINVNLISLYNSSSFDLILRVNGTDNYLKFTEKVRLMKDGQLPSVIILDDNQNPTIINSSFFQTYNIESYENLFNIATVIHRTDSNLLFATIQMSSDSVFDIIPFTSINQKRSKRSFNDEYIVKKNGIILEEAHVSIQWHHNRKRRAAKTSKVTKSNKMTSTKKTPIDVSKSRVSSPPKKVVKPIDKKPNAKILRPLYFDIIAVIDSLILSDVQTLLNKSESETFEILQLYYIHIFLGVEQIYRQSFINESMDIHIRLSKLILSTDKYRLPWEQYKNISSITNTYRKSPNNVHLRPNISLSILKSLHQAYTSNQFDKRFFTNTADHIMTFTRLDLINGAGLAFVSGFCLPLYKYSIIQEDLNSYSTMITASHELGHNLGLSHDETENTCYDPNIQYIMSPENRKAMGRRQVPNFSRCSIKEFKYFLANTPIKCWENKIISTQNDKLLETKRNIISGYLGQLINIHQQCQLNFGFEAIPYISVTYNKTQTLYDESICESLQCFRKITDQFMYSQDGALYGLNVIVDIDFYHFQFYLGTPCGENRVCRQKKCVATKQKLKQSDLALCPYGDLFVPISMLNLKDKFMRGNMLCSDALNLLRKLGMNVTHLCYDSIFPYRRLCCEECKK